MAKNRSLQLVGRVLIILYVIVAIIVNCWVLGTLAATSQAPTIIQGTVRDGETQEPLVGAVVGARQPDVPGSTEVTVATDAAGRYRLKVPPTNRGFVLFASYAGASGDIVKAPLKPGGASLQQGQSQFQIVARQVNMVDWEVAVR